jgi:hypothetical protein
MPEEETAVVENPVEAAPVAADPDAPSFSWRDNLPDGIDQTDPSLAMVNGTSATEVINQLAGMHLNAQKMIGRDKISIPGKDASDEEMRHYMTQTGCPETVDGYTAPTENVSEKFDADLFNASREEAHRLGMSPAMLAGMSRFLDKRQSEAAEEQTVAAATQMKEWEAVIQKEHGDAFAQNTAMAKAIIHEYGGDDMESLIEERGFGSHPALFNMLSKIGRALGEDEVVGQGGTHSFISTPDQATAEWAELQRDSEFMERLNNAGPGHADALEKQTQLFKLMHPEKAKA